MEYLVFYINKYNGNYACWHSTNSVAQEAYKKILDKIIPKIVNKIEEKNAKKIKATLVLVLLTLKIFSGIVNANANPKDCVSIFEELIKTSNFRPELKSRKYFKIDLYDVSVTDVSIFFKFMNLLVLDSMERQ